MTDEPPIKSNPKQTEIVVPSEDAESLARANYMGPTAQETEAIMRAIAVPPAIEDYMKRAAEFEHSRVNQALRSMAEMPLMNPIVVDSAAASYSEKLEELGRRLNHSIDFEGLRAASIASSLPASDALMVIGRDLIKSIKPFQIDPVTAAVANVAHMPATTALVSLMEQIDRPDSVTSAMLEWQARLSVRLSALDTSWVLPQQLERSFRGFARLSRLSEAAHSAAPYDGAVLDLIAEEFGNSQRAVAIAGEETPAERDAAAVGAGLNPELIAFPPASYGKVVLAAGFSFQFGGAPVPRAIEAGDPHAAFDTTHSAAILEVELRLRQHVESALSALSGTRWVKQRVPLDMRNRWSARQEEDRSAGRPVYAPIYYSDFMDLAGIIGEKKNWLEAFAVVFKNREDFIVSLTRLHPVRKAIAHARPLSRIDVLTLVSEATRILGALGIRTVV